MAKPPEAPSKVLPSERQRLFDIEADGGTAAPDEQGEERSGLKERVAGAVGSMRSGGGKLVSVLATDLKRIGSSARRKKSGADLPPEKERKHRDIHVPRWARIGVLALVIVIVAIVIAATVLEIANVGKISKGVRIDGIPVGGLTTKAALEKVNKELAPLSQPIVFTFGSKKFEMPLDRIKLKMDTSAMTGLAYLQGRGGFVPARAAKRLLGISSRVNVPVLYVCDQKAVNDFVEEIGSAIDSDPVSASISIKDAGPVIKPSQDGVTVQRDEMKTLLAGALTKKNRSLGVPVKYSKPQVVESDIGKIVVIALSQFRLYLYNRTDLINDFVIACGMPRYPTPPGRYHITYKERNPTWLPTSEWAQDKQGIPQAPGPNNPLGGYWMDIGGGLGIHATPFPSTLGSAASHGCIRMSDEGAGQVFNAVKVGTPVFIIP